MSVESVTIAVCPSALVSDALTIVLRDLNVDDRQAISAEARRNHEASLGTLYVAISGGKIVDAAWGQPQAGNCAVLWPPQLTDRVGEQLLDSVAKALDRCGIRMSQIMVVDRSVPFVPLIEAAGFEFLADLLYLSRDTMVANTPLPRALSWRGFNISQLKQFARLTEASYSGTQDCPAINGRRPIAEVLDGYRGTGKFRSDHWQIAQVDGNEVAVLMLADHGAGKFWELVYMGLVPTVRGRGFGREIVLHALELARAGGAPRLLVAVDAANGPALKVYRDTGFSAWDRRAAYVRFRAD